MYVAQWIPVSRSGESTRPLSPKSGRIVGQFVAFVYPSSGPSSVCLRVERESFEETDFNP